MSSSSTRRAHGPSIIDLVFVCVAIVLVLGAATPLTQSDGDLFAHIRLGRTILAAGHLPATSTFGLTTAGAPMVAPAWLGAVVLAIAYHLGGLALVTIVAALTIASAHALVGWTLRRRNVDARWMLGAMLVSIALGATHWLARPHMFSLLGASALIALLETDARPRVVAATAALFVAWANLHGGWIFGLGVLALYAAGDALAWMRDRDDVTARQRATIHGLALAAGAAATVVNPYGLGLHRDVLRTVMDPSVTRVINEYQAPAFRNGGDLAFLGAILLAAVLLARTTAPMRPARLLVAVATLGLALMSGRNIALFAVTGWTLIALHAAEGARQGVREWRVLRSVAANEPSAAAGPLSALAAIALLSLGVAAGPAQGDALIGAGVSADRFPVVAVHHMKAAHLDGRMYAPWDWGGYVVLAWPHRQAFIDPLRFDARAVDAYRAITLVEPGWRDTLARWDVSVVLARRQAPIAVALAGDAGWRAWHRDSTATVFVRVR